MPGCAAYETAQEAVDASDVVFITTTDGAIGPVAGAQRWRPGQVAVHCAGAASLDVLEPAVRQGALAGAMHPLQTFSSVEIGVKSIPGTTFGIEAEGEVREYLREMAVAIGGNPVFLASEDKALYHLTGVMMGGLLTTLGATAAQLFKAAVTKQQWEQSMVGVRRPLGKLISRKVKSKQYATSLPGAPDGEYVVIQFQTSFENKRAAIETVTPMLDKDGKWRVSGYYIK